MSSNLRAMVCVLAVVGLVVGCSLQTDPTSPYAVEVGAIARVMVDSGVAALGDVVWFDADMDGLQGDPLLEPGIKGAMVYLIDCNGGVLDSTVTDKDGFYVFDNLTHGDAALSYQLQFTFPAGDDFGPRADEVTPLLPIWLGLAGGVKSIEVADGATAYAILSQDGYGKGNNGIAKLYAQLLAAKLNIVDGADDGDIALTIAAADAFLALYDWTDWKQLEQNMKDSVQAWQSQLDDYNNGIIGPGHCMNEWVFSDANVGADDAIDSDADPVSGLTDCVTFAEPAFDANWDAGMYLIIDEGCTHSKGYWKNHTFVD